MTSDLKELLEKRIRIWSDLFAKGDLDALVKITTDDLDYSDYTWNVVNMSPAVFHATFSHIYKDISSVAFETVAISGTKEFCAWEWVLRFTAEVDDPAHGMEKGKRIAFKGVSLQWWRPTEKGEDGGIDGWKLYKGGDYDIPALGLL